MITTKTLGILAAPVFVLLYSTPAFAQNHQPTVAQVKADLVARGLDLSGPCGAFQITKRVAWQLRSEGAGLLDKPSGNSCLGYAVDIIAYPGGQLFDILTDSGGNNGPGWGNAGTAEPGRYRPAFDPGDTPSPTPTPVPIPTPIPPPVSSIDLSGVYQRIDWTDANNERRYLDLAAKYAAVSAQATALAAQLKEHDEQPSWARKVFTNPLVLAVLASAGSLYTGMQIKK